MVNYGHWVRRIATTAKIAKQEFIHWKDYDTKEGTQRRYYYKGGWNFKQKQGRISKERYDQMSKVFTQNNKVRAIARAAGIDNKEARELYKEYEKGRDKVINDTNLTGDEILDKLGDIDRDFWGPISPN